jgi:Holliday junction resolvase RusA-like endonuclease
VIKLVLVGNVPGKKNSLMPRKDGKGYFNKRSVQSEINDLIWQIKAQYRGEPLDCPTIKCTFHVSSQRGDLDNKYTTIQDALVKAGVLINDNIKHMRGPVEFVGVNSDEDTTILEIT